MNGNATEDDKGDHIWPDILANEKCSKISGERSAIDKEESISVPLVLIDTSSDDGRDNTVLKKTENDPLPPVPEKTEDDPVPVSEKSENDPVPVSEKSKDDPVLVSEKSKDDPAPLPEKTKVTDAEKKSRNGGNVIKVPYAMKAAFVGGRGKATGLGHNYPTDENLRNFG